jgi:hypothetical protein
MFRPFADWIATAPLSTALKEYSWIVPTSQSLHIVSIALLFSAALLINARLCGLGYLHRSILQTIDTLTPWVWRALLVLVATGTLQTIAEPVRQFVTPVFWIKLLLIVINTTMTFAFARLARGTAASWTATGGRPPGARTFAALSTLMWVGIIVCGRFIGYTWSFYA